VIEGLRQTRTLYPAVTAVSAGVLAVGADVHRALPRLGKE
jgi:hypothetical protein